MGGLSMNPAFLASREIGNNLAGAFSKAKDENAIENILSQAMASGDPQVLQNSIGQILSQVSPERQGVAVQYLQNAYNNVQKKQEQTRAEEQQRNAAKQGGYTFGAPPQVQAQQLRNKGQEQTQNLKNLENKNLEKKEKNAAQEAGFTYGAPPQVQVQQVKNQQPVKPIAEKPTTFQKILETQNAKDYQESLNILAKARDSNRNLDLMKSLSDKLTGIWGQAKAVWGTEDAAQLDALGLASIEPILKIFNPVGAIPTQKIELVKNKFAPKSTDRRSIIEGKIKALKIFNDQAMARAQAKIDLINEYQGNPPPEAINQFDRETEELGDILFNSKPSMIKEDKSNQRESLEDIFK